MKLGVLLCLLWLVGTAIGHNDRSEKTPSSTGEADSTEILNQPITDSCKDMSRLFGHGSNLTTAQKDELWEQKYKDQKFKWTAQVVSVEKMLDEGYEVHFGCPAADHPPLLRVYYDKTAKGTVLNFKKGRSYPVIGKLLQYEAAPEEIAEFTSLRLTAEAEE